MKNKTIALLFAIALVIVLALTVLVVGVAYADANGCPNAAASDPGQGAAHGSDKQQARCRSISGTVYDESGTPLPGILVDIVEGGVGVCTDENGFWRIEGLDPGSYDIVAGRPFCGDPEPPWAEQVILGVKTGTKKNDFFLRIGFFTTGTVYDESGITPLSGILVDIFDGGFGVCTNEIGFWRIEGLTPGTYDMIAGRPFCGDPEPPWDEQTIFGVVAGTSGNDFLLSPK